MRNDAGNPNKTKTFPRKNIPSDSPTTPERPVNKPRSTPDLGSNPISAAPAIEALAIRKFRSNSGENYFYPQFASNTTKQKTIPKTKSHRKPRKATANPPKGTLTYTKATRKPSAARPALAVARVARPRLTYNQFESRNVGMIARALLLLLLPLQLLSQQPSPPRPFHNNCAACHGDDARGTGRVPASP